MRSEIISRNTWYLILWSMDLNFRSTQDLLHGQAGCVAVLTKMTYIWSSMDWFTYLLQWYR